ncbi:penicillin-binding protein activator [Candidatus Woesearchaeota archaeon]|nr:penicillin-binding protein activator [Candidatus Woesearchaeota archaeon]
MNKTKLLLGLVLIISIVFLINACTTPTGEVVKEDDVIKVGVILPLTGKAAAFGEAIRNGLDLALEEINKDGKRIELVYEEEACDPKQAVTAYHALRGRGVHNIIGAACSVSTLAIAPLAEQDKTLLFSPASAAESITEAGDYIFRNHGRTSIEMKALAEHAYKSYKNYAIVYDSSNSAFVADNTYFTKYIEALGGKVVFSQGFEGDATDFKTILLKLKGRDDIDAVFPVAFKNQFVLFVKQMNEFGIDKPVIADKTIEISKTIDALGELAEGIAYPVAEYNENTDSEFWNKYLERFNEEPPVWAAQGYDNLMILADIFERCDSKDTACVKDELYKVQDYPGVAGTTSFDKNGDAVKEIVIKQIKNGEIVIVKDKEPAKIGVILPLTGKGAAYGEKVRIGIDLALEDINKDGKRVELIIEDGQGDPKHSVSAIQKLININGVDIILGPGLSDTVLAVAPIAEENKILLFAPLASSEKIKYAGDYIFRSRMSGSFLAEYFAKYIYTKAGVTEIAVLHSNSENAATYVKAFNPTFEDIGGEIILTESFNKAETDYRTLILKLKQKGVKDVFFAAHATEMGYFLKQADELDYDFQMYATPGAESDDMLEIAGETAEGMIFCSEAVDITSDDPVIQEFRRKYKAITNKEPDFMSANGYDALQLIVLAGDKYGFTPDGIKKGLYETKDYPGIAGTTSFDSYGEVIKPLAIKTVENGEFVMYDE